MPIFEYTCNECHHDFETLIQGSQIPACPQCESESLEKQFSVFAVNQSGSKPAFNQAPCNPCGDPRGPGS